jgi:hypothetical protein
MFFLQILVIYFNEVNSDGKLKREVYKGYSYFFDFSSLYKPINNAQAKNSKKGNCGSIMD